MSKRILFFAVAAAEREVVQAEFCRPQEGWEKCVAGDFDEAIALVAAKPVDAIVVDCGPDDAGVKLLNWATEHHPKIARVLMAEAAEHEGALRVLRGPHQFLAKPVTPEVIVGTVESMMLLNSLIPNEVLLTLASRIKSLPPMPSLYFQIVARLKSPDCSAQSVAEILTKDMAMTTRLLQVVNSGGFGLSRRVTEMTEVVNLLGLEEIKSLVLGVHLFETHERIKPLYFSISQVWRHSTAVAVAARTICRMETGDEDLANEAYLAGLLHDLGKLVLQNNLEAQYNEVQRKAKTDGRRLWEVEAGEFGVSHAEIGGYVMGRWGMPMPLIDAVSLHHQPGRSPGQNFSALAAVHVANALVHERDMDAEPPELDQMFLESLGCGRKLDAWREAIRVGASGAGESNTSPSNTSPASRTDFTPSRATSSLADNGDARPSRRRWVAAACAAAVAILLGGLVFHLVATRHPLPVRAKTPADPVDTRPAAPVGAESETGAERAVDSPPEARE